MEIGSYFWSVEEKKRDIRFFLSGRTALDYIIRDILLHSMVDGVLLPSYCCHSMIEPFYRNHIPVRFYDIVYQNGKLTADVPEVKGNYIFFHMEYFGYDSLPEWNKSKHSQNYICVMEDRTHSWAKNHAKSCDADYFFISYRKWSGFDGIAIAAKTGGKFKAPQNNQQKEDYNCLFEKAKKQKENYIMGIQKDKSDFLKLFKNAEEQLEIDYVNYAPSIQTLQQFFNWDVLEMKKTRRANAKYLIQNLKDIPEITLLASALSPQDVPLHVPVLVSPKYREPLRAFLISKEIYCPIHWQLTNSHEGISDKARILYDRELSLICDQRYGINEMERILIYIKEFFR